VRRLGHSRPLAGTDALLLLLLLLLLCLLWHH
jgi:hypothetical protein